MLDKTKFPAHTLSFILPEDMREREHSKMIDRLLGFKILKIEQKLIKQYKPFYMAADYDGEKKSFDDGAEAWIGLHPQILLTPYSEIYKILTSITRYKIKSITDFGCAYGRIGIVASVLFPECKFIGYEIVSERAREAERVLNTLDKSSHEIYTINILDDDFKLPKTDVYFIYDFGHVEHIKKILDKLVLMMNGHDFILVARGDEVRSIIQMYYPSFYVRHKPLHKRGWSIFFNHPEMMN